MRKIKSYLLAGLFLGMAVFNNSCLGSFELTKKLYSWNNSIGDKWVNNLVFWAFIIIPVYEVVTFLDTVIINVIEFWSGTNPVAMNEGDEEIQIVASGNKEFKITATKNKFHIEEINGQNTSEWIDIIFNPEERSCYIQSQDGLIKIVEYTVSENGSDQVKLFLPNDNIISLDANTRNPEIIQNTLQFNPSLMVYQDRE